MGRGDGDRGYVPAFQFDLESGGVPDAERLQGFGGELRGEIVSMAGKELDVVVVPGDARPVGEPRQILASRL